MREQSAERWFTILSCPDYSVSSYGRVMNKHREQISITRSSRNAPKVAIFDSEGVRKTLLVHKLVADAFVSKRRTEYNTVIHLNGNREDNYADNLAWRSRGFAWEYGRQFQRIPTHYVTTPIVELETGRVYIDIFTTGICNGLLFKDIEHNARGYNRYGVFPSAKNFRFTEEPAEGDPVIRSFERIDP